MPKAVSSSTCTARRNILNLRVHDLVNGRSRKGHVWVKSRPDFDEPALLGYLLCLRIRDRIKGLIYKSTLFASPEIGLPICLPFATDYITLGTDRSILLGRLRVAVFSVSNFFPFADAGK